MSHHALSGNPWPERLTWSPSPSQIHPHCRDLALIKQTFVAVTPLQPPCKGLCTVPMPGAAALCGPAHLLAELP